MKKSICLSLTFIASHHLIAATQNELDASYTFSKVIVKRLPFLQRDDEVTVAINDKSTDYYPNYSWSNQGSLGYKKNLVNSNAQFAINFTGVHALYKKSYFEKAGSQSIISLDKGNSYSFLAYTVDASVKHSGQFNYFGVDLSVIYPLRQTKHANFSVQGGGIIGGFKSKNSFRDSGNDSVNAPYFTQIHSLDAKMYQRDVFTGPNIKILLNAPFFKNHLMFNLNVGIGLMMTYETIFYSSQVYSGESGATPSLVSEDYKNQNNYRFCPQADLEASIGFSYKDLTLTGGLNQFCFVYDASQDRFSSVVFGGPFVKATYKF
jgi:hypothetical protein